MPFFVWAFGKEKPLSDLSLESCSITEKGFHELIGQCLPVCREPLNKLSLSDNRLGRSPFLSIMLEVRTRFTKLPHKERNIIEPFHFLRLFT
jgi:hypothetical protein